MLELKNNDQIKELIDRLSKNYEVYENTVLNGTAVDYLFLNKHKGVILLNLTTQQPSINDRLSVCLDNLYLSENNKLYLSAFGLVFQNNEFWLYKNSDKNYLCLNSGLDNSDSLYEEITKNLNPLPPKEIAEEEAEKLYNNIHTYFSLRESNEDFFVNLSKDQQSLVTDDLRRIRFTGAAGSGKTLVVAMKAARNLALGKKVLITSFNITMIPYIRALTNKALSHPEKIGVNKVDKYVLSNLVTIHIHGLLSILKRSFCETADLDTLDEELPELLLKLFRKAPPKEELKKDLIIIDEGQDFQAEWFQLLSLFVKKNGSLVITADAKQDIYDKSCNLTGELFKGLGFKGPWRKLKATYRLPSSVADLSCKYAENFLLGDNSKLEFGILPSLKESNNSLLFGCNVSWYQCNYPDTISKDSLSAHEKILMTKCREEVIKLCTQNQLNLDDICVLCNCKSFGRELVKKLNEDNIPTASIFSKDYSINRKEKLGMGSNRGYLKCSTIHSFKGWESYSVILINVYPREDYDKANASGKKDFLRTQSKVFRQKDHSVFYVGLTRVNENMYGKSNLVIINEVSDYQSFADEVCKKNNLGEYKEVTLKDNVKAKIIFHQPT
ncbi:AAA family ATPase [Succinivibrio dextrinosolvens]|uniref:AAA family ATPase n=1 Tax=Succinivibrio dextrinosolvens TaxID=83771 RepID=UPI0019221C32|nr:AAA family ATPase [Succinivibrio dextrinosolvens]